jgi:hypothetical protein
MKYLHPDVLDGGLLAIQNNTTKMILLSAGTSDFTAATTTNKIAEVTMTSGDFTITNSAGTSRTLATTATKEVNATISALGTPDLHVAFVSGSKVLFVTDETTNQPITAGNPITFPIVSLVSNQPAA